MHQRTNLLVFKVSNITESIFLASRYCCSYTCSNENKYIFNKYKNLLNKKEKTVSCTFAFFIYANMPTGFTINVPLSVRTPVKHSVPLFLSSCLPPLSML